MSDQPGRENIDTDLTSYSIDDEDQLQAGETLEGTAEPFEENYTVADHLQGSVAFGITADEQSRDETIDQRILQEVPDPDFAYGAPDNESGLDGGPEEMVGGDDPDAIPAETDFYGAEGQGPLTSRLVAPDEGSGLDVEPDAVAREGQSTGGDTAEEAAMHYVDGDLVPMGEDGDGYLEDDDQED